MARLKYPSDFDSRVKLLKNITEKHEADGDESELNNLRKFKIATMNTDADVAKADDKEAKKLAKLAEDKTEDRDNNFDPVMKEIRRAGQYLKQQYAENPNELGKWGFKIVG